MFAHKTQMMLKAENDLKTVPYGVKNGVDIAYFILYNNICFPKRSKLNTTLVFGHCGEVLKWPKRRPC